VLWLFVFDVLLSYSLRCYCFLSQYDGDKWDAFYEAIPISLLHHTNGNGIYNTSHPLLERLVGQLEVEAPCPYNSIPYDYRMSQMWVEGTLGIVPKLAPKIMLNEEGQNITLSDNTAMFKKWANRWQDEEPYKFTKAIHNYAATNLIPRHLGPEYVIHGAKLYSPWDPSKIEITLVISDWFFDRSLNLIKNLDARDHPFSKVIIMIPPSISNDHDYSKYTRVPVTLQFRDAPDVMDLCSASVSTEWFMITNSYHQVAKHVDLMFTPGKFVPVIPFTPATYPFCLKYPYCKEIVTLAQRWNPKHKQVVLDMDMLYNTKQRNAFCNEWVDLNGEHGEDLYAKHQPLRWKLRGDKIIGPKGPTGTDYLAYLTREKKDSMYKMTDRSLYGARAPFVKVYRKEEKLDGMSEDELARRLGMTLLSNITDCSCDRFDTQEECLDSGLGCQWRPLFESCHPPEMIDDGVPICETTEAPTMSPTLSIDRLLLETESPTSRVESSLTIEEGSSNVVDTQKSSTSLLSLLFKSREHQIDSDKDAFSDLDESESSNGNRFLLSTSEDNNSVDDSVLVGLLRTYQFPKGNFSPVQSLSEIASERKCPTWNPSVVPRHLRDLPPSREQFINGQQYDKSFINTELTKSFLPGRSIHTQHQLIKFETKRSYRVVELPRDTKRSRMVVNYGDDIDKLRVVFDTSNLLSLLREMRHNFAANDQYNPTSARISAYVEEILPSVASTWGNVLTIYRPMENITPRASVCGETDIPKQHLVDGVVDADVVLYVEMRDQPSCSEDSKPRVSICHFDQNMRPLFGSLSICLDDMEVQDDKVYENEKLKHIGFLARLVGRFLGLSPNLFQYYRNPETGELWGERPMQLSCGGSEDESEMMVSNFIEQRTTEESDPYYELSTPTVTQVVRNHFDCQSLTGARLDSPLLGTDGRCLFPQLDLRYHFDEDMTSISQTADTAFSVSTLSLALLEDSSWYKANFASATTATFGRGAGCGFVGDKCISNGNVPEYATGYFCNVRDDAGTRSGCDFTHRNKAACDLNNNAKAPSKFQYFRPDNPEFGSPYEDVKFCPMRSKHLVSCSSRTAVLSLLPGEFYDDSSRCYETDNDVPVCLETKCSAASKTLDVVVNGNTFHCRFDGEVINAGVGYSVICPRIAVMCPDLICPSNCSGKGVCDYCKEVPECVCDSPFDQTPGCWES
jgi:hypothetical protein